MVFTPTMKYLRYNVLSHVTIPEKQLFGSLCKQVLINSNKIKAAGKDVGMGNIVVASLLFSFEN